MNTNCSQDFFEYYKSLKTRTDQKELRHQILKECKITKDTFYKWMYRGYVPDEKNRAIIALLIGEPVEILFPQPLNIETHE